MPAVDRGPTARGPVEAATADALVRGRGPRRIRRHDPLRSEARAEVAAGHRRPTELGDSPGRASTPCSCTPGRAAGAGGQFAALAGRTAIAGRSSRSSGLATTSGGSPGSRSRTATSSPRPGARAGNRAPATRVVLRVNLITSAADHGSAPWSTRSASRPRRSSRQCPTPGTIASSTWATTAWSSVGARPAWPTAACRTICFHEHWTDIQNYPRPRTAQQLRKLVARLPRARDPVAALLRLPR